MNFEGINVGKINVEFKDMNPSINSQRTHAKVVLIDRATTDLASPQCYILKNDINFDENDIENLNQKFQDFLKEDFILIGEIVSINKASKYVLLKDQNTISYEHLIIASGNHYSLLSYEFLAGVHTLVDAIRVRRKIPSAFPEGIRPFPKNTAINKQMRSSKANKNDLTFPKKIENIQNRKINKFQLSSSPTLSNSNKRLYEVQI